MSPPAKSSGGASNNSSPSKENLAKTEVNSLKGLAALMAKPLFSFASDATPEFQTQIATLTEGFGRYIDSNLKLSSLGGDVSAPFSAVRDGDVVHLMYPQHVKQGDLFAAVITAFASQVPTCVLHQSSAGWSEPEWSSESRRHLAGLLSGLESVPQSFAHTSSPADLARISLWITACASALSVPGGVGDTQGDVLPSSVGGQKSASKYMLKVISGLRSNITDESCLKAVDTLSVLIKLWQKSKRVEALSIAKKCKLSWSAILFRAAPTEVIKGKKRQPDQTVIRPPVKPSRSPWLSPSERSELGNLLKDDWSFLEAFRSRFIALSPEQQHRQFNKYISDIKSGFEKLNALSSSIHAKLGKRKYWIERVCRTDGYKPKPKKGESESFLLSAHFFKKNLSTLDLRVKKAFAPVQYLPEERFRSESVWSNILASSDTVRLSAVDFTLEEDGIAYRLWQIWADMTLPRIEAQIDRIEDPPQSDDFNPFLVLAETPA